jgi:ADP-ribose pyrophosphatase YjhB (NUDIX family)
VAREAARVVLVDPGGAVLLLSCTHPESGEPFWLTPGGGLEPGESPEEAARRELAEEVGVDAELGPLIWLRRGSFRWNGEVELFERYYLVRVEERPEIAIDGPLADPGVREVRWWTADELAASGAPRAPGALAELLAGVLRDGPPAQPLEIDR